MKLNIKTLIDERQVFNETYLANLKEEKDYFIISYKDNYQEKIALIIYKNLEKVVIDKNANQLIVEKEEKITAHKLREGIVKLKTQLKCAKIIKRGSFVQFKIEYYIIFSARDKQKNTLKILLKK